MSEKAENTKKLILDAALTLVRKKGFAATSIRDICKAAKVSIGAFYHYFPSRDALLNDAFFHFDVTLTEEMFAHYDSMPPLDALRQVLLDQTAFTANEGYAIITEYYRALLQGSHRDAVSPERLYYQAVRKYVQRAQAEGVFAQALSSTSITEFLIKFVRGCLVDWCLHNGNYDVCARTERELVPVLHIFETSKP